MTFSPELLAMGKYLSGEFENKQQALDSPAWYVHLRLWLRPVPLFQDDSITLFAEQASIVNLDRPYRPRLLRIKPSSNDTSYLEVQHYMFEDIQSVVGAGSDRNRLNKISENQIKFLPDCTLAVTVENLAPDRYCFRAMPNDFPCSFTYEGKTYQVALGFEVTPDELQTYDKGIDPNTGNPIWGALLGPYRYTKVRDFSDEIGQGARG
ncbi:MAG: chromophore lyase CpcT/CpeT [Xenococcaceae cyanobacterium]